MKKNVVLSAYCWVVSSLMIAVMLGAIAYVAHLRGTDWVLWVIVAALVSLCVAALFYMPMSVSVDNDALHINRSLRIKSIPLSEIKSVEPCPPTMSEKRICGSGGFFGYWGRFTEPSVGRYFAYYGKASDCFLVTLKNGRKYMLGCQDAPEMVAYIRQALPM